MTTLAALYNAAEIILWVEDLVTSAYLGAIWGHDSRLKFYIGGGHENLAAVVEDARRQGRRGVFGLRDRDFGPTNRDRWRTQEVVNFALETFEIECFLLDPPALAECALNVAKRSEAEIRARLEGQARELLWWMACRCVIAELREARQQRFPPHPRRGEVPSREVAVGILLKSEWVKTTVPGLTAMVTSESLIQRLDLAHAKYAKELAEGSWPGVFSGKEIVGELVRWLYTRNLPKGSSGLEDLAKAVAQAQVRARRVPAELRELHEALVTRRSV